MNIEKQLASYKNIMGLFANPKTLLIGKEMPIHIWWKFNGFELSNLQKFAIKGFESNYSGVNMKKKINIMNIIEKNNMILKYLQRSVIKNNLN
jgi:hypothetical protein